MRKIFVCVCVCVLSNSTAISCPIWLKFWTKLWIAKEQRISRYRVAILSNFWFYVTFLSVTLEPIPSITHTRLRLCATKTSCLSQAALNRFLLSPTINSKVAEMHTPLQLIKMLERIIYKSQWCSGYHLWQILHKVGGSSPRGDIIF